VVKKGILSFSLAHGGSDPDGEVSVRHHSISDVVLNVGSICFTQVQRATSSDITGEVSEGKSIGVCGII